MRLARLLVLLAPLLLTACDLSPQQKADYAAVQSSGVSSAVYDKMIHGDALSVYDIKSLARARVSDGIIIRYLRDHQTIYELNSGDVQGLLKAGVSQSVIDYMLQTPRMYQPSVYPAIGFGYDPFYYGPYWYPYPYGYRGYYYHGYCYRRR